MKQVVAHPGLSAVLLVTWLALNNSIAPEQIALGVVLALGIPKLIAPLLPAGSLLHRPTVMVRLLARVFRDIIVANIEVARRILGPESAIRPQFIWVPLDTDDSRAITVLAAIITLTPGTLSADLSDDRRHLLVHVFDMGDGTT